VVSKDFSGRQWNPRVSSYREARQQHDREYALNKSAKKESEVRLREQQQQEKLLEASERHSNLRNAAG
jgi:hypothetical protein